MGRDKKIVYIKHLRMLTWESRYAGRCRARVDFALPRFISYLLTRTSIKPTLHLIN